MCRNIRRLHHFEPPTTPEEIEAAALQYVRKVSGATAPVAADREAFERAVARIAEATGSLLSELSARGPARTREGEKELAKLKWRKREARILAK